MAIFFLFGSILFFWASLIVHPDLVNDAIVSIALSIAAIGLSQIMRYGLFQVTGATAVFFILR
jgi:hypothetical protein